jgi:MFS family permease
MPTSDVSDSSVQLPQELPAKPKSLWWSNFAAGFRSLRIRNYRLYSISQLISLSGTWMQTTAQAWLVLRLTDSPFQVGFVVTLQFLPVTILALFGGVLADRLPKRQTIIATQTLALLQAAVFGLLVITGVIQLWQIYVLAAIQGIITAIDNPVRQAFVVDMVGREDLANAVALNSTIFNGARILGPALAGVVIKLIDIAPALFLNALSFVPVIIALLMMNPAALFAPPPAQHGSMTEKLREGLNYSLRTPSILLILIVVAAIGTFGYNFSVVLPLLADKVLHTDAFGFGLLSSCLGLGSLVGAIQSAYVTNITIRRLLIGSGAFSLFFAAIAVSTNFYLTAILLAALGLAGITFSTSSNT